MFNKSIMDLGLAGKIAIVTGGASGIGREVVLLLAEEGAITAYIDKDKVKGEELDRELTSRKKQHKFLFGDLTDDDFCKKCIDDVINEYGRLNILINNAGGNDWCDIDNATPEDFRKSLDKNLVQCYAMAHFAWPYLKQTKGNIVFTGSKVAIVGEGYTTAYAAAKGGINSMTRELAAKSVNENLGIRVNCVIPAIVRTPKFDEFLLKRFPSYEQGMKFWKDKIPLESRPTEAREVANEIVFLASIQASHTTGQIRFVDGGYVHIDRNIPPGYMG